MTLLKKFIGWAFDRHAHTGPECHNADYEVCPDLLCRMAVWLEATFNPYAAWHDTEDDDDPWRDEWEEEVLGAGDIDTGWPEYD